MTSQSPDVTNNVEQALRQSDSSFLEELGREMDTVLASIVEEAELLKDTPSDAQRLGARIQKQGEQLRSVFHSLTHLARLEQEQAELASESVNPAELGEELLASYEQSAREQGLGLSFEASGQTAEVTTDPDVLRRALTHLLSNAISFTQSGEVTLRVDVAEEEVAFHVEDTGKSVPSDVLSDMFEAFTKHSPEEQSSPPGIGLGLSLAQAFARRIDGSIDAETNSGAGSVFTLRVPRHVSLVESSKDSGFEGGLDENEESEDEGSARVLVLEDNTVTQKLLRRILEADYQVDVAARADEALQKVEDKTYDVLVLDINLGERRTGVEVLHEVRRMEQYSSIPAVACTAYAMDGHYEQFLQVGFNEVVTKPVTKRELFEVIEPLLDDPSLPEIDEGEGGATGVELPPFSSTLIQITDLVSDTSDTHDVEALTRVIEKDQVISFWLLRQINSAYYSISESVNTVERAVHYLGFRPVCNLVLTKVMARRSSDEEGSGAQKVQQYIMKTGSLTAFIARELAETFEFGISKLAYTAGLLAQLGRLALLTAEGEAYVNLWFQGQERTDEAFLGPPPRGQEILHCEKNYLQKGVAVGKTCKLSNELLAVLRWHSHPLQAKSWSQPLVPIVALGLEVAYLVFDPEQESWGGESVLIDELQGDELVHSLVEQESLSREELTYATVEAAKEGREFVDNVLSNA